MKQDVVTLLKSINAVITEDHFVYTSGKHGSVYINKDILYTYPEKSSLVGTLFAEKFKGEEIDVIAAPAVGGTILTQWSAYHLGKLQGKVIRSVYTEKDKGTMASAAESEHVFRRGYDKLIKGKNVLVLEDLTTTGISVKKVVEAVKMNGGNVVAVCVMVNRNPDGVTSELIGAPFSALGVLKAEAFDEEECPMCRENKPINTSVGHGKKYLEEKKK